MTRTPCFPFNATPPFRSTVTPGDLSSTSSTVEPVFVTEASTFTIVFPRFLVTASGRPVTVTCCSVRLRGAGFVVSPPDPGALPPPPVWQNAHPGSINKNSRIVYFMVRTKINPNGWKTEPLNLPGGRRSIDLYTFTGTKRKNYDATGNFRQNGDPASPDQLLFC